MLFHIIDGASVILQSRGVFRQAKVYRRDRELFAGHGSGFVRLHERGGTSVPNIVWVELDVACKPGRLGRLEVVETITMPVKAIEHQRAA